MRGTNLPGSFRTRGDQRGPILNNIYGGADMQSVSGEHTL